MTAPRPPAVLPLKGLMEAAKQRFFLVKSQADIDRDLAGSQKLKRTLGAWDLIALGIGAIIGAGIFVLTGVAARDHAGPAIVLSFVITGVVCAIVALCYAELASTIPAAGSAYTYSYATMGELVAWVIGWNLILEYSVGAAAVAGGWSGYLSNAIRRAGVDLPMSLTNAPGAVPGQITYINLPAMGIILLLTVILVLGVKESARFNIVMVVVKMSVIMIVITLGASLINPENVTTGFWDKGLAGIMGGAGTVFFAYIGFDALSTVAEETKDPQRNLPRGILGALAICTVLYILAALVLVGIVPTDQIDITEPFAAAFANANVPWGRMAATAIAIGAIVGITSVLLVSLLAQPRVLFALARDGMVPDRLGVIHPKYGTPHVATLVMGTIIAILAGVTPIEVAAGLTNIGTLAAFVLVCTGVIILRFKDPNRPRGFRVPFDIPLRNGFTFAGMKWTSIPLLPIAGIISCCFLIAFLAPLTQVLFIGWMGAGLIVYSYFGYHRSRLWHFRNGKTAAAPAAPAAAKKVA